MAPNWGPLWSSSVLYLWCLLWCKLHLIICIILYFPAVFPEYFLCSMCCSLDAVWAQRHLSRPVGSAWTQPAVGRVGAGTAEQQRLLLEATVSTPRTVGGEQVVGFLGHSRAADPESGKWKMNGNDQILCIHLLKKSRNLLGSDLLKAAGLFRWWNRAGSHTWDDRRHTLTHDWPRGPRCTLRALSGGQVGTDLLQKFWKD